MVELIPDGADEGDAIGDEVDRHVEQIKRHGLRLIVEVVVSPPRLDPAGEAAAAFQREVDVGPRRTRRPR